VPCWPSRDALHAHALSGEGTEGAVHLSEVGKAEVRGASPQSRTCRIPEASCLQICTKITSLRTCLCNSGFACISGFACHSRNMDILNAHICSSARGAECLRLIGRFYALAVLHPRLHSSITCSFFAFFVAYHKNFPAHFLLQVCDTCAGTQACSNSSTRGRR
jgi:hypothetical protein